MRAEVLALALSGIVAGACLGAATDVDENTEKEWLNHTLPLPHEITVEKANRVAPGDIGIRLAANAGAIERNAAAQLRQMLTEKTGIDPAGGKFEIILGVLDPAGTVCGVKVENAGRLDDLPNRDQAYLIQPVGDDKLLLAALDPKGIYYAAQTLRQLLGREIGKDVVSVPLANVVDWPDLAERGLWNVSHRTPGFIPWLTSFKLNVTSYGTGIILKKDARAECPKLPVELIDAAREHAFLLLPHGPHFDYWWRYGANEIHPELVGKGDGARNPCFTWGGDFAKCRNPCMATPLLARLNKEWLESAYEQGVREVSLWLSEHTAQCECEACLKDGRRQMLEETQAAVAAITAARATCPDLQGRIFFTMAYGDAVKDSYACLAVLPPEIKAERVYARNEAFDKFAASGRWLVDYNGPPLGPGYFVVRYTADEIRTVVRQYVEARYSGLFCRGRTIASVDTMGHWDKLISSYQYSALAEWSWNANGRDVPQFATAWATLNGVAQPARFTAWIDVVRPVESLVRRWEDTSTADWLSAAAKSGEGTTTPAWTTTLPEAESLRQMLARCDQAQPLADATGEPSVILETRYLKSFLLVMAQIRELHRQSTDKDASAAETGKKLEEGVSQCVASIQDLGRICEGLMRTPDADPASGPQQKKARYDAWTRELSAKVAAIPSGR